MSLVPRNAKTISTDVLVAPKRSHRKIAKQLYICFHIFSVHTVFSSDPEEGTRHDALEQKSKKKAKRNLLGLTDEEKYELSPRSVFSKDSSSVAPVDKQVPNVSRHSQMHSNVSLQSGNDGNRKIIYT